MGLRPIGGVRANQRRLHDMTLTVEERAKVLVEALPYIKRFHGQTVVISGEDGPTIIAEPLDESMGFVGRVTQVNKEPITALLARGYIPVIASIGLGYDGHAYNINADTVAAEIAVALKAAKVILLTDVAGGLGADGGVVAVSSEGGAPHPLDKGGAARGPIPQRARLPAGL